MVRILIADDHHVIRSGLRSLLSTEKYGIDVIGEAGDGKQAVEMAHELQPDVILMDMQMPQMNGLQAIQEIMEQKSDSRILVLSSFGEDERVAAAMRAGALGYLLKDSSPDELISAIHAVALGHLSIPKELSRSILGISRESVSPPIEGDFVSLTDRELQVLQYLAKGDSNKEIANQLSVGLNTVRTHVSSILRKLNLENRTQAALFAREKGLHE